MDKHYLRKDVQEEMLLHSQNREISVIFGKHFGKRPDILKYPADIVEHVKNEATSFHVSVERWKNPMQINTNLRKVDLDNLRTAWDLLFDLDIPDMGLSKILAHLIIKAMKDHGIESISIKFSGNKGFHIGVPFEVFPKYTTIGAKRIETRHYFPEGPIKISEYLMDYISKNYIKFTEHEVIFDKYKIKKSKIKEIFPDKEPILNECSICNKIILDPNQGKKIELLCEFCSTTNVLKFTDDEWERDHQCPKCKRSMTKNQFKKKGLCDHKIIRKFDLSMILEVDRQIFSSRHMYRMVYSLHEKSGLVSIPFNPEKVMKFDKKYAKKNAFKISKHQFMQKITDKEEGTNLLNKAKEFVYEKKGTFEIEKQKNDYKELDFTMKIPKELFPPCIINGLKGMKDGKKRFLFVLKNFLLCSNYTHDEIKEIVFEWNKNNPEPLKENIIIGQLRYSKQRNEQILPPNCFYQGKTTQGYYLDMALCEPDDFCPKIKNPFNYSKRKTQFSPSKPKKPKKSKQIAQKDKTSDKKDSTANKKD